MSDKNLKRFIILAQYFPSIFLWVLVPQLAYISGTGGISAINTFESRGLFGLIPMPSWVVIAALIFSGVISSIKELPLRTRAIPAFVISAYGLTVAINFRDSNISAASMLGSTYLIGAAVAFVIIWALTPVMLEMLRQQEAIQEKVAAVSEHIIQLENKGRPVDGAKLIRRA